MKNKTISTYLRHLYRLYFNFYSAELNSNITIIFINYIEYYFVLVIFNLRFPYSLMYTTVTMYLMCVFILMLYLYYIVRLHFLLSL